MDYRNDWLNRARCYLAEARRTRTTYTHTRGEATAFWLHMAALARRSAARYSPRTPA